MKKFKQIIGWLCLLLLISCSEQRNSAQKITQTELQTGEYSDEVLLHLQSRARQLQLLLAHYGFQGLDRNPLNLEDYGYKSH